MLYFECQQLWTLDFTGFRNTAQRTEETANHIKKKIKIKICNNTSIYELEFIIDYSDP